MALGDLAFITHLPCEELARTLEFCRVLVVPRSAWESIVSDFPLIGTQVRAQGQGLGSFRGRRSAEC